MFFPKETTPIQKVLFIGSSLASLGMFISFMNSYAVDVLMADRIDTWSSLFNNDSLWDGFIKQHGPHRVGLLFIFSKIGYVLGHSFDTRYDLFVNAAVIWAMIPLGFWVKYRITKTFNWYDLIIPFLICATWQWTTLILNPHIHVMLPLFTLMFAALLLSKFRDNLFFNSILIFAATFSVYAIFAAILFVLFQSIKWMLERKWIHFITIVLFTIGTLLFYFHDFRWATLNSAGHFSLTQALKAPILILSNFLYVSNWLGLFIILGIFILSISFLKRFNFNDSKKVATLFIFSSAISFVFFQSIGRSGDDPAAFSAFRYYTELVLFIWAIAIIASSFRSSKILSVVIFSGFSWLLIQPDNPKRGDWIEYTQKMEQLKECVLETQEFEECNRDFKLLIHVSPNKSKVVEKWLILEQRKQAYSRAK